MDLYQSDSHASLAWASGSEDCAATPNVYDFK